MGVNKRRISENMIKDCLSKQQSLKKLFNVDIIILTDTFQVMFIIGIVMV
jgi:hypothetical protein